MRHIKQMTYQELNNKNNEVSEKRRAALGHDAIKYQQLMDLGIALGTEATLRAQAIGVQATAQSIGIVM